MDNAAFLSVVPRDLLDAPQWVVWRVEIREGKPTKVPYNALAGTGEMERRKAAVDRPHTWSDVQTALRTAHGSSFSGVGFVVTKDNGFTGIDLDDCYDEVTEEIEAWARAIVEQMQSYTEISPSQTGLRIWIRANLPPGRRRKDSLEMYDEGRFFTVTGNALLDYPLTIEERQDELEKLHKATFAVTQAPVRKATPSEPVRLDDQALLKKAQEAKNGQKFWHLWRGDASNYGDDLSRADLALCGMLAFWTGGDASRMDRLFRQSGLMRDKWDSQRGESTYGQRTILTALSTLGETYSPVTPLQKRRENSQERSQPQTDGSSALVPTAEPVQQPKPIKGDDLPLTKMLADAIHERGARFALDADEGVLYAYNDGVYCSNGETVVRQWVKRLILEWEMPAKWTRRRAEEVIGYIRVDAPTLWERPPMDTLNVKNGLLDIKTRTLREHTPDFLSPTQLPVLYDDKADCAAWDWLSATILPSDASALAFELAAWLMTPYTSLQKAIMLTGEGGNGKSRLLAGLRGFLGMRNVSTVTLQDIESDRFSMIRLYGKLANICADLSSVDLVGTGKFKQITDGMDPVKGERKFGQPVEFTPYARLVFSANTPPKSPDNTQAFYDRWLVIPFPNDFRGADNEIKRDEIDAWLTEPSQLSGLLNRALDALPHILAHGFSEGMSTKDAHDAFQEVTNPFSIWLSTTATFDVDAKTLCEDMRLAYAIYCQQKGGTPLKPNQMTKALRARWPGIVRENRMVNGERRDYFIGLRMLDKEPGVDRSGAKPDERWDQRL